MKKFSQTQIEQIKQLLDEGAVVAVPTETVYGLAAKLTHPKAVEKLLDIKSRKTKDDNKVLALMIPNNNGMKDYAVVSPIAQTIADRHFPGELTMVLPKNPNFKNFYFDHFETVGIRIPNHDFMLDLLRMAGPLLVTSANPRGGTPCANSTEVEQSLPDVDAVVEGESGGGQPSTVISIVDSEVKTLRQGALIFNH